MAVLPFADGPAIAGDIREPFHFVGVYVIRVLWGAMRKSFPRSEEEINANPDRDKKRRVQDRSG